MAKKLQVLLDRGKADSGSRDPVAGIGKVMRATALDGQAFAGVKRGVVPGDDNFQPSADKSKRLIRPRMHTHHFIATARSAGVKLHGHLRHGGVSLPGRKDERLAGKGVADGDVLQRPVHLIILGTLRRTGSLPRMKSGVTSLPIRVDPSELWRLK